MGNRPEDRDIDEVGVSANEALTPASSLPGAQPPMDVVVHVGSAFVPLSAWPAALRLPSKGEKGRSPEAIRVAKFDENKAKAGVKKYNVYVQKRLQPFFKAAAEALEKYSGKPGTAEVASFLHGRMNRQQSSHYVPIEQHQQEVADMQARLDAKDEEQKEQRRQLHALAADKNADYTQMQSLIAAHKEEFAKQREQDRISNKVWQDLVVERLTAQHKVELSEQRELLNKAEEAGARARLEGRSAGYKEATDRWASDREALYLNQASLREIADWTFTFHWLMRRSPVPRWITNLTLRAVGMHPIEERIAQAKKQIGIT